MKFELDEYYRNVPDEDLLEDLRIVARKLGQAFLTVGPYKANGGKYAYSTIHKRFGGWNLALDRARLRRPQKTKFPNDALLLCYLEDLRNVAAKAGKNSLTGDEYLSYGGQYSVRSVERGFGSWNKAIDRAGLLVGKRRNIPDEQLFLNIESMWTQLGRQPTHNDFDNGRSKISRATYAKRFGTWRKALEGFVSYMNDVEKDGRLFDEDPIQNLSKSHLGVTQIPERKAVSVSGSLSSASSQRTRVSSRSRHISWRMRFLVMRRDGFKCTYCGRGPANTLGLELQIDHEEAWSKNGPTTMSNLRTACNICNIGKSDLDAEYIATRSYD